MSVARQSAICARLAAVEFWHAEPAEETIALVAAAVDELRSELDLEADPSGDRLRSEPCLTSAPAALDVGAPEFVRFRQPRGTTAPLPDWWARSAKPVVYVSFGSVAAALGFFPTLYRAAIDALAELSVRVLVTLGEGGDADELGPLPANVHAERWVDQDRAIPHAAVVVCHGGFGSMLGALAHGVPLVVVPLFAGDQWHNARRIAQIGAGVAVESSARTMFEHPPLDALPRAVAGVLDDGVAYRRAAREVAPAIAALRPIDAAVDALAAHAAQASLTR
jgi:UDP:flavonoid glycosyltransferase YjiC (YdhE family)